MKKLLFETAIVLLSTSLIVLVLFRSNPGRFIERLNEADKPLDVISLGTSHGACFIYDKLNVSGQKFNRHGNTLFYDLQHYQYLKPYLADSAIVIVPVSYMSFGLSENRIDTDDTFVNDFYLYLSSDGIHDFSWRKKMAVQAYQVQKNFRSLFVLENYEERLEITEEILIERNRDINEDRLDKMDRQLEFHARTRVQNHIEMVEQNRRTQNFDYLKELLTDALQSGFRPILVTVPYHRYYHDGFDPRWLAMNYQRPLKKLSVQLDIPLLSYGTDERFSDRPELFRNSDHLNEWGSYHFSRIFFRDLVQMGYLTQEQIGKSQ